MSGPSDACSLLGESCWDYSGNEAFSLAQALSRKFSLLSSPTSSDYSAIYTREKTKSKRIAAKESKMSDVLVIFFYSQHTMTSLWEEQKLKKKSFLFLK